MRWNVDVLGMERKKCMRYSEPKQKLYSVDEFCLVYIMTFFFYRFRLECFCAPEQTQPLVEVKTHTNTKQKARKQQKHTPTFYADCNWKNWRLKKEIKKKLRKRNKRWNSPNELEKWTWIQKIEAEHLNDNNFIFGDVRLTVSTMESNVEIRWCR